MVSVVTLLFLSFFIVFIMHMASLYILQIVYNQDASLANTKELFLDSVASDMPFNASIMLLMFALLTLNSKSSFFISILLMVAVTYLQSNVLLSYMEDNMTSAPFSVRSFSMKKLLSEKCTMTLWNLHVYLGHLLKGVYHDFKYMMKLSINDAKVAFYLLDPKWVPTTLQKRMYELQSKLFKYHKPRLVNFDELFADEKVFSEYQQNLKEASDPSKPLNAVRSFPWKLKFTMDSDPFLPIFLQNILVFYNFFKTTLVALLLMFIYFVYTVFFFKMQFLKQLAVWFVMGMLYFWLMSGFNFFLKSYQYGKFTSAIQRFWKSTNAVFWLIEGFLILLFFYYYLNSSQEPIYMHDYSSLNQEYLVSLHVMGLNVILLSLVMYFMYFTMLSLNSNSWTQVNLYLMIMSVFVFFSFFLETYQFYYVISVFNESVWTFNEEENLWFVDIDSPIIRNKQQYLFVCLMAKYWHFLFIFLSWVFFLIKSFESSKVTIVLFGANLQNMMMLYLLNFACYMQWFKWLYSSFFDLPYTWFMTSMDSKFVYSLFFEAKLLAMHLVSFNPDMSTFKLVVYKSLTLWNVDSLAIWKFL